LGAAYQAGKQIKLNRSHLEKDFGEILEDWVESIVVQVTLLLTSVMVEIDEVFNVVMRTYILYVLFDTNTHHICQL